MGRDTGCSHVGLVTTFQPTTCTVLPTPDSLVVVFLLPERAVQAARMAGLPEEVMQAMGAADVSKFGHAFNVFVADESQLDAVATLARIKLESA